MDLNPQPLTESTYPISQDLMKLRVLMSHHRMNSVRDKVKGKKQIYLERNTLHRQCGPGRKARAAQGVGFSVFIGVVIS